MVSQKFGLNFAFEPNARNWEPTLILKTFEEVSTSIAHLASQFELGHLGTKQLTI